MTTRTTKISALVLALVLSLAGCAEVPDTQRRAATGTVLGGAGGAGVGLLGGLLYDQNQKAYERGRQDGRSGR